jgi:nucleoside-diphosphate-sugar epimerase
VALHLVTGANGYVGSFIVRELMRRGEQVRAIDVVTQHSLGPGVDYRVVDVLNMQALREAAVGVDYIHHNAALVPLRKAGDLFWRVNVDGTRNVLLAAKACGVKHISHMSSSAIFGSISAEDCPITHRTQTRPIEAYGRSKLAGEQILSEEAARPNGISCSIVRPRTIIGTERLGIFQVLFEWVSEGRNIYIIGDGRNQFQFAHVQDLVEVSIETALGRKRGIFNIGTDDYGTLLEVLEHLCRHADTGSRVVALPIWLAIPPLWLADKLRLSPLAPWHYLTYHKPFYFDLSDEFRLLEWRPKRSNDQMMTEAYDWYIANRRQLERTGGSTHRSAVKQRLLRIIKKLS